MNIVIDDGNSRTKIGTFDRGQSMDIRMSDADKSLKEFLSSRDFENAIVSSVRGRADELLGWIPASGKKVVLTTRTRVPFQIKYKTPDTLGVDRIAAVAGALDLFPRRNCLVIDAGTCITYEFINSNAEYMGGAISPGVRMRFEAMHKLTARLPLVTASDKADLVGASTEECMQSGVMNGITEEIRGIVARYKAQASDLQVILCGGDSRFFENIDKPSIFVAPNLVLQGLRAILISNVE